MPAHAKEGERGWRDGAPVGVLIISGASVTLFLGSGIHACLLRSIEPWGKLLSPMPGLLWLTGLASCTSLLVLSRGRGTGRAAGVGGLLLLVAGIGVWSAAFARADPRRPSELRVACMVHVKDLTRGLQMYAADYGAWPAGESWRKAALQRVASSPNTTGILRCPVAPELPIAYGYSRHLGGTPAEDINDPDQVVVIFESRGGTGVAGAQELLPNTPRHLGGDNYGFADGHAGWYPRSKAEELQWQPVLKEPAEGADRAKSEPQKSRRE